MSQPYVGEIRIFAGNFAPAGWMFCEGQLMDVNLYATLFQLIGTTYGGDGQNTFALPDLRGRLPLHQGSGFTLAETGGVETVTLTVQQIPQHNHPFLATTDAGSQASPIGFVPAANNVVKLYTGAAPNVNLNAQSMLSTGGSQPHDNFQPYLCIDFIISLYGIFPTQ